MKTLLGDGYATSVTAAINRALVEAASREIDLKGVGYSDIQSAKIENSK